MKKQTAGAAASIDNIYRLDGKVPVAKAIPFGLQHVLAMFVANVAPIILVAQVAVYNGIAFTEIETARLIQNAMLIAGIGTLIQLYPIWRIGSKLPVVMGISFTFVSAMMVYAARGLRHYDRRYHRRRLYRGRFGPDSQILAPLCGPDRLGLRRDDHRLLAAVCRHQRPIGASNRRIDFGSWQNLLVGDHHPGDLPVFYQALAKGFCEAALCSWPVLVVGYIAVHLSSAWSISRRCGSTVSELGVVSFPQLLHLHTEVSSSAPSSPSRWSSSSPPRRRSATRRQSCNGGLGRDITVRELSGLPGLRRLHLRRLRRRVRLLAHHVLQPERRPGRDDEGRQPLHDHVRRTSPWCSAGLFPPIGAFFSTLPECVLGGCTVMMFGAIIISGVTHAEPDAVMDQRNTLIAATSLSIGIGVTLVSGFFDHMPKLIGDIFAGNPVAGVFVVAMVLSLAMPKHVKAESIDALTPESIETPNPSTPEQRLHKEK